MSLLVVGSVAFDSVETPVDKIEKALGGSATFCSVAASYFANDVKNDWCSWWWFWQWKILRC